MRSFRVHRELAVWIAVLAVVLASLAPAVSHALGSGNGASWMEVCTPQGSRWVPAGAEEPGGAPVVSHALAHCPCCVSHAPALGLPPATVVWLFVLLDLEREYPPTWLAAPRMLHAWASAQPRAPPLSF